MADLDLPGIMARWASSLKKTFAANGGKLWFKGAKMSLV
jgi:hypothetical protein